MANHGILSKTHLTIRLPKALAASLEQMFELHRPAETKLSLSDYASQLLEGLIADFRCAKLPPPKVYDSPHDCKNAFRTNWLGALPPW